MTLGDANAVVQIEFPTNTREPELKRISREKFKAAATDPDPTNQKILGSIVDMGNAVLSKRVASDLHA